MMHCTINYSYTSPSQKADPKKKKQIRMDSNKLMQAKENSWFVASKLDQKKKNCGGQAKMHANTQQHR